MSPKNISSATFEYLIALCTTNVLFFSPNSQIFRQHDGLGMGSPLGPYHANAFMSQFDGMVAMEEFFTIAIWMIISLP